MRYSILWSFNIQNLFQRNGQGNHILFAKVTRELPNLVKINSQVVFSVARQLELVLTQRNLAIERYFPN